MKRFADNIVNKDRADFIKVGAVSVESGTVEAWYTLPDGVTPGSATLYYNTDETIPFNGGAANVIWTALTSASSGEGKVTFTLPGSAKRFYINFADSNTNISTSKLVLVNQ